MGRKTLPPGGKPADAARMNTASIFVANRAKIVAVGLVAVVLSACAPDPSTARVAAPPPGHDDHTETPVGADARRIDVVGDALRFEPAEITVHAGEPVAIVFSSTDILHDFTIDDIDAHVAADAGETAEGGLSAPTPGRYTFYCSVPGHREGGMVGTLIVE